MPGLAFRARRQSAALTLLELVAVVVILGILSSIVLARYGRTMLGDFGSQADARKITLALAQARRSAIASGRDSGLEFTSSGGATTYRVFRTGTSGTLDTIDGPIAVSTDCSILPSHAQMVFDFEGKAGAPYTVVLTSVHRIWTLEVIPINGSVRVTETRLP